MIKHNTFEYGYGLYRFFARCFEIASTWQSHRTHDVSCKPYASSLGAHISRLVRQIVDDRHRESEPQVEAKLMH